jgi:hypothetical protein
VNGTRFPCHGTGPTRATAGHRSPDHLVEVARLHRGSASIMLNKQLIPFFLHTMITCNADICLCLIVDRWLYHTYTQNGSFFTSVHSARDTNACMRFFFVSVSPRIHHLHSFHFKASAPLLGPGLFFSFVIIFTQTVGLLGRVISPSQGRYLHTGQHKHRINAHTDIHALSGIRTHDPSFRASEDSSCLKPRGHCDRHCLIYWCEM